MIVVLDVSAAVEILLCKEKSTVFQDSYNKAQWVISPDLYVSELSNVVWKCHKSGWITHDEGLQLAEDGMSLIDDFMDVRDLWKEALTESIKNNHPVYDMVYAILARRNGGVLITNDKKLSFICTRLGVDCIF